VHSDAKKRSGDSRSQSEISALTALRDEREKLTAQWAALDAEIAALESRRAARAREKAVSRAAARSRIYRDGNPRDTPAHREIARRYAWQAWQREKCLRIEPGRTGESKLIALIRMRELERIFSSRYGPILPDDDAGREDLMIAAHHIAHLGGDAESHIASWARLWAPWMTDDELEAITADVMTGPRKFRADTLGRRLRLSQGEREDLAITTIGAVHFNAAQRKAARKHRRWTNERARRRAQGAKPRADYQANAISCSKPWQALGISRATWYRRRRFGPENRAGSGGSTCPESTSEALSRHETSPWPAVDLRLVAGDLSHSAPSGPRAASLASPCLLASPPARPNSGRVNNPFTGSLCDEGLTTEDSSSARWRSLQEAALARDAHTCTVPGCGQRAVAVNYIDPWRDSGTNVLTNLKSMCDKHAQYIESLRAAFRWKHRRR
jgi:hypothetical protein